MKSEDLLAVMRAAPIKLIHDDNFANIDSSGKFERDLYFAVDGVEYSINWFHNLMTLKISDSVSVMFTKVRCAGTWPNEFKTNLQFYQGDNVVCVIGVERY